ncbi:hypothetical protein QFX18_06215 [Saccharophagus degradans]|uniref:hypothetical protein n=1 Tax=Saccharophagus degradans TaxID=86304 RepID=UPI0024780482|nr:hypothetical protein [Saccharophagus degradans]WGO99658.1 hypothetical protein QFX18_06215 [Saccharophagus degradans]
MKIQLTDAEAEKVYQILGEDFFKQLDAQQRRKRNVIMVAIIAAPIIAGLTIYFVLKTFLP